ncbi:MAG: DUF3553 domain-containing protein [Acidocella sp. 20-57-95]|nr:MAG: DUF3553 domain-containing protein [Acidocella sp. 20-57-95]OYV60816.1 MAG: DUF3553 domain-containing protein [Acidocella sp. 21-58-7]HQT64448.1 DUF3553 domain-containing protein [Acidocella sp.]HQU04609.1 DUF3553 domain-containing protein [Acidocella sp.]
MNRAEFEPGDYVRNARQPDWGLGQVQTAVGEKVTVMFEHAGKVVVNTLHVPLDRVDAP